MSGVYIKGMEMPTKDGVYTLRIWGTGQIERLDGYHSFLLSGVKAVPVPDHGRLIDADAIEKEIWSVRRQYQLCDDTQSADKMMYGVFRAERLLKDAPTIIPAEKEDGE